MSKKFGLIFFIGLICQFACGQQMFDIKCKADFIELDNLDNIYAVKGSELKLYGQQGEFIYRYSNKINGVISCVDVTNPLKIIVFYKESNTVVFLNQQLSAISDPIDIYEAANIETSVVGFSSGGSFWAFSNDRQSLILFNSKVEKAQESQNLTDWIEGNNVQFIREKNQKVYLGLPEKLLVFDMFGLYLTTLHFKDVQFLKMIGDQISYIKDQKLWVYNTVLKNEIQVPLPNGVEKKAASCNGKRIYVIFEDSISIYKVN